MYNKLGALEEFVLLMVLIEEGGAYSVSLAEKYLEQTGKEITIPAMHTVLQQLEKKEFVTSYKGGATKLRGGRSKRLYKITKIGYELVKKVQVQRVNLWELAPKPSF